MMARHRFGAWVAAVLVLLAVPHFGPPSNIPGAQAVCISSPSEVCDTADEVSSQCRGANTVTQITFAGECAGLVAQGGPDCMKHAKMGGAALLR